MTDSSTDLHAHCLSRLLACHLPSRRSSPTFANTTTTTITPTCIPHRSLPSISIVCLTASPVERARKKTKRGCHPSIPPIVPVNGVATSCSAQQFIGQEEEKCQLFNATLTTYPSLSCPRSQPRSPTLLSKLVGCRALPHHCPSRQCVSLNPRLRGHASSS